MIMARPLALWFLLLALASALLFGLGHALLVADYELLDSDGPIILPPLSGYQYTPSFNAPWDSATSRQVHVPNPLYRPLFFGNSFRITNVRLQNDTASSTKRLSPTYHFAIQNQTIAIEGQEYLVRPRFYANLNSFTFGKRAPRPGEVPYTAEDPGNITSPFIVTPQWAAFRLTNATGAYTTGDTVAFFQDDTMQLSGAEFTVTATNPSAMGWNDPRSLHFNISDLSTFSPFVVPAGVVQFEWVVACRWVANGTDCAPSLDNNTCPLFEFGYCWARTSSPNTMQVQKPDGQFEYDDKGGDDADLDGMTLWVGPRPVAVYSEQEGALPKMSYLFPSAGSATPYLLRAPVGSPTDPLIIELSPPEPLSEINEPGSNTWKSWLPGPNNAGGFIEVSVDKIVALFKPPQGQQQLRYVDHIHMDPPIVRLSAENYAAPVRFLNVTFDIGMDDLVYMTGYFVFFQVVESNPATQLQANTTGASGSFNGIYPNGAYFIPPVLLQAEPPTISLANLFPEPDEFGVINYPISQQRSIDCANPGPAHIARISASPASMGLQYVRVPFNFTPGDAIQFFTCPTGSSKRQALPSLIDHLVGLEFVGNNTAVEFYLVTQPYPYNGVTLQFFTPTVDNTAILDPSFIRFDDPSQNATYTFNIIRNPIYLQLAFDEDLGGTISGPYVNQPFYLRLTWTPPAPNGFLVQISGLYTTFEGYETLSQNKTLAWYRAAAGSTGMLIGPLRVSAPIGLLDESPQPSFSVVYTLGLYRGADNSLDHLTYELPTTIFETHVMLQRFSLLQYPNTRDGRISVPAAGLPSEPFCIAPAFSNAIPDNTSIWWTAYPAPKGEWLILDPVTTPSNKVRPPNAIEMTAASPTACFTARFDTNWQTVNTDSATGRADVVDLVTSVSLYSGGPGSEQFVAYLSDIMPEFNVLPIEISLDFRPSAYLDGGGGAVVSGEDILMWASINQPVTQPLFYNLTCPSGLVAAIDPGAGTFVPGGPRQQLWRITPFAYPFTQNNPYDHAGHEIRTNYPVTVSVLAWGAHGSVTRANSRELDIWPKEYRWGPWSYDIMVGINTIAYRVEILHPVRESLTITPVIRSTANAGANVTFTPNACVFTPSSPATCYTGVMSEALGPVEFEFRVSGPDEYFYRSQQPSFNSFSVGRREGPTWVYKELEYQQNVNPGPPYGPYTIGLTIPARPDEDVQIVVEHDENLQLSEEVFDARVPLHQFTFRYVPVSPSQALYMRLRLEGADAWKYILDPEENADLLHNPAPMSFQFIRAFACDGCEQELWNIQATVGVRYTGALRLSYPAPVPVTITLAGNSEDILFYAPNSTVGSGFLPVSFAVGEQIKNVEYKIMAPLHFKWTSQGLPSPTFVITVPTTLTLTGASAPLYFVTGPPVVFDVRPRFFYLEPIQHTFALGNPDQKHGLNTFMINRQSPLYTVVVNAPPENNVTLTLSHPSLRFNDNQPVAALQFGPGVLAASFSFTPIRLPLTGTGSSLQWSFAVSGPDAEYYDYSGMKDTLSNIKIVPELGFTPIPAIPTDGALSGLKVWLVNALPNGFPYVSSAAFVLEITCEFPSVIIEPNTLEFSRESLAQNRLSQEYSIRHTNPADFGQASLYALKWALRYRGASASNNQIDLNGLLPRDAQYVQLTRYQLIPVFPHRLNFDWQDASFNLTRAPQGSMIFVPLPPPTDGARWPPSPYGGSVTAGGRIVFDPAVIAVQPGQEVVHFRMRALPGNDQRAVYYRVHWRIAADPADLALYSDWAAPQTTASFIGSQFATWHLAAGLTLAAQLSVAMLVMLAALVLLL